MRGRPRIHSSITQRVADALASTAPPPKLSPVELAELEAFHRAVAGVLAQIDDAPEMPSRLAWKWRQIAGVASELEHDLRKAIKAAGGVPADGEPLTFRWGPGSGGK